MCPLKLTSNYYNDLLSAPTREILLTKAVLRKPMAWILVMEGCSVRKFSIER